MRRKTYTRLCPSCLRQVKIHKDGHNAHTCGSLECILKQKSASGLKTKWLKHGIFKNDNRFRENSPRWNGGKNLDSHGYFSILTKGGYQREHRLVMEKHLGRKLLRSEYIHHLNGIKTDNRIENLRITSPSKHKTRNLINHLQSKIKELEDINEEINKSESDCTVL